MAAPHAQRSEAYGIVGPRARIDRRVAALAWHRQ